MAEQVELETMEESAEWENQVIKRAFDDHSRLAGSDDPQGGHDNQQGDADGTGNVGLRSIKIRLMGLCILEISGGHLGMGSAEYTDVATLIFGTDQLNTFYARFEAAAKHASSASGTPACTPRDPESPPLFLSRRNPSPPACLDDYHPVALTSVVMKCFERLLEVLGLSQPLRHWISNFLTDRPQAARVGKHTSSTLTLITGAPQDCVLSPLLYSLYTYDCVATSNSTTIIKFADDTVVMGLISNNNETAYLQEVKNLERWCQENNLLLNFSKTKELIMDFSTKQKRSYQPLNISGTPVERVDSFRYSGVHITQDLHINTLVMKAWQRLDHLRRLRDLKVPSQVLKTFYTCTIENNLTGSITSWFGNSTMQDRRALQGVVPSAGRTIHTELPDLQDIYSTRCRTRARKIMKDLSYPNNGLISLLWSYLTDRYPFVDVNACTAVKDLGVIIDPSLSFESHLNNITRIALFYLRNIAKISNMMLLQDAEKLVHAFVTSRLDYCNALLSGCASKCINKLQLVQNAAARVLTRSRKYNHITPVLISLHWLPIKSRIDYKILLLTYKALNGLAPQYLSELLYQYDPPRLLRSKAEVRKTLCRVNPRKSAGPDNTPGRVLRKCAEQLADVLTDIFNISLSSNVVPTCLKTTTIVPVPKKSSVSCLNDYRPVALTPIVMKCFERLVMRHIKTQLPPSLDPMQFAYRPNPSTDDAISTTLHLALTHLDNKDSYVRMLFIDFSSAFNKIIPQHLIEKFNLLGLNTFLCNWILDFLTERPQSVRIGNSISSTTTLSTGAPQGCVLSPLLFTLLTHDCVAMHSSNHIIEFADDTTVVGLISKNDESAYREEVQRLTAWCEANNLSLNVDKTKEMVVDFRRAQSDQSPLIIDGFSVEIVKSTKFLGVHLADNSTWSLNTSSITKKAQQHLYFLRRLRKTHLPPPILSMFYRGTIESILSSCITAWFGNCTISDRKSLQRLVRTAEKIIRISLPSIMDIYITRCIRKAHSIVDDHTHPSHTLFTLLRSEKRFRSIRAVTTRLCNSFFPQAIRLLNTQ
ncbi:gastrula zinc finger protein XlCGF28.1-like [Silurus asotus]|uniref:Gastrula zinc finger protein XlCGF28.1-like n=1 Tax=Silurus asotus TaxID=30991 RepID=A0AAD5FJ75_SILAS|nr:gastrula zinc finger protein XlCGF28.1-like [Silurus asotus]